MADMRVECYSGYRADERPMRFVLCGREYEIAEVEDRWYSPGVIYFRVRANDGNFYVLKHDEGMDVWTLDAFRANRDADLPTVAAGDIGSSGSSRAS
jgi:hypothetical protein